MAVDETLMCSFKRIKAGMKAKKVSTGVSGKKVGGYSKK